MAGPSLVRGIGKGEHRAGAAAAAAAATRICRHCSCHMSMRSSSTTRPLAAAAALLPPATGATAFLTPPGSSWPQSPSFSWISGESRSSGCNSPGPGGGHFVFSLTGGGRRKTLEKNQRESMLAKNSSSSSSCPSICWGFLAEILWDSARGGGGGGGGGEKRLETEEGFVLGVRRFGRVGLNWSLFECNQRLGEGEKRSIFCTTFQEDHIGFQVRSLRQGVGCLQNGTRLSWLYLIFLILRNQQAVMPTYPSISKARLECFHNVM